MSKTQDEYNPVHLSTINCR